MPTKVNDRPRGTRCHVPGYLNDADQIRVDGAVERGELGIAPLLVAGAAKPILGVSFKKPSQKKAAEVIGGVISSALSGNLTAVKCLWDRRSIGIAKERAVWVAGYNKVASQRPDLIARMQQYIAYIPAIDHSNPGTAAQTAIARAYTGPTPGTVFPTGPVTIAPPTGGPGQPPPGAPGTISILPPYTPPPPGFTPQPYPEPGVPGLMPGSETPTEPGPGGAVPPAPEQKLDMGKLLIPALIILGISMVGKKGR